MVKVRSSFAPGINVKSKDNLIAKSWVPSGNSQEPQPHLKRIASSGMMDVMMP